MFGTKDDMMSSADKRIDGPEVARLRERRASTIRRASAARTSCTCCSTPTSRRSMPACPTIRASARWSSSGRACCKYAGLAVIGLIGAVGFLHHVLTGANRVTEEDEENAGALAGGKS